MTLADERREFSLGGLDRQELADDPMVQYHLAMTYLAVGRKADALTQFNIAIALVKPDDTRDFVASAKAEIAKLQAEGITANN